MVVLLMAPCKIQEKFHSFARALLTIPWAVAFFNLGEGAIRNSIILNNNIDSSAQSPSNCINNNSGLITRGLLLGGDNNGIANYDMGSYERQTSD